MIAAFTVIPNDALLCQQLITRRIRQVLSHAQLNIGCGVYSRRVLKFTSLRRIRR